MLEVGVQGKVGGLRERAQVRQHLLEPNLPVLEPQRPRESGTRGRHRGEPKALEAPEAADVPRVRDHEEALLVQRAETCALLGGGEAGNLRGWTVFVRHSQSVASVARERAPGGFPAPRFRHLLGEQRSTTVLAGQREVRYVALVVVLDMQRATFVRGSLHQAHDVC